MPFSNRVCRFSVVFSVLTLACLAPRAYADSAPMWTDRQLVDFSDVIVRGRVARITVAQDERVGSLYTYVSLDVASVLKGSLSGRRVVLKQLGGRLGSTELRIAGQPSFAVGEDVLVFLESRPRDRTLTVTAQWQGKFTITSDASTGETATRDDPSGAARGIFAGQTRALASWLAELRKDVGRTRMRAASEPLELAPSGSDRATLDSTRTTTAAVWRDQMLAGAAIRLDMTQGLAVQDSELRLRQAADFWTGTGITSLATGGLQPAGCFTTRAPDGRITFGADACEELSPRGGTIAISGGWIQYDGDANGVETPRFLGAGVITNRGETAARWLAQPACFDQLARHEIGHALGLIDSPDGSGVMAPTLNCGAGSKPDDSGSRATFVPLDPGVRSVTAGRDVRYEAIACKIGCGFAAATSVSAPNPPTNLSASLSGLSLILTWTAPVIETARGAASAYVVEAGTVSGGTNIYNFSTGNDTTTSTVTVTAGTTLFIRVRGTNGFGIGDPSNEIVVTVPAAAPPSAPQNLTFSQSGSTVTINWTAPTSGGPPTTYIVEAGSSSGAVDIANISTESTATSFSATVGGTAVFYVRVRARNATGTSAASNEVIIPIGGAPLPPGAPSNLSATAAGNSVALSWTAPTTGGAVGTYIIQAGSTQGTSNLANFSTGSTLTTFSTTGVPPGTYFVRVRGSNASGAGPVSNEIVVIIVN